MNEDNEEHTQRERSGEDVKQSYRIPAEKERPSIKERALNGWVSGYNRAVKFNKDNNDILVGSVIWGMFLVGILLAANSCRSCVTQVNRTEATEKFINGTTSCKEKAVVLIEKETSCIDPFNEMEDTGVSTPGGGRIFMCKCPAVKEMPKELLNDK